MYLVYKLIWQKPVCFLSAQMAGISTIPEMFVVAGIYHFGLPRKRLLHITSNQIFKRRYKHELLHSKVCKINYDTLLCLMCCVKFHMM